MSNCLTCGGLIMEPNKAYGYAGPICTCYVPPKIQRPMVDNGFNFSPSNAIIGVDKKHYDDLLVENTSLKEMVDELSGQLLAQTDEMKTLKIYLTNYKNDMIEKNKQLDELKKDQLLKGYVHTNGMTIVDAIKLAEERDSLKAQVDELKKSNTEMSDLIYSEDGYIASQDELNNEIRKWSELYLRTEKYGDKVADERDSLKQALDVAVSTLKFYGNTEDMYDTAYECEGPCIGYIPNEDDFEKIEGMRTKHIGKRARQALTSINEILNQTKQSSLKDDLEQGVKK